MPMSRHRISGREVRRQISESYGGRGAGTHSASAERPGTISDDLRAEFEDHGYGLCTSLPARGLIEVFPHPALIEFSMADYRLEYKVGKAASYWPKLSIPERQSELCKVWAGIVEDLDGRILEVAAKLPLPSPEARGWRLKAYEDKLDAVVCAAVAIAALDGKAQPHGDDDAAIWVPLSAA